MPDPFPIALEAYEQLAERYTALAETKAENGYTEHPAMRKQLGDVRGLKVLDAGCGPGFLTEYLVQKGAQVTGFDISPKMLGFAKERLQGKATLHLANLAAPLTFLGDGEFDIVVSSLAIDYVKDWSVPLREFYRVLKPRGRLVFTVQHPIGAYLWYKLGSYAGVQKAQVKWKSFGGEPVIMPDYFRSFEAMVTPLLAAGFTLSKMEPCLPIAALKEKDRTAWERLTNMPAFLLIEAAKK